MEGLVKYNPIAQHYGTWLRGYNWSIYGCGTFRCAHSQRHAIALGKRFFERLERILRVPVSYAGIFEHRYSGLGLSPIPLHLHFLAASKAVPDMMAAMAQVKWQSDFGNAKIVPYDPDDFGAHYVSKLAAHDNGSPVYGKLHLLQHNGPSDLFLDTQTNPYVPDRLKNRVYGEYLVARSERDAARSAA